MTKFQRFNAASGAVCVVCVVMIFLSNAAPSRAADSEDLTGVKLPHGQITLPDADAAPASQGFAVRFSDEKLFRNGAGSDAQETPQQVFERMKRENKGDLVYTKTDQGTLHVLSGKVMDLGPQQLQFYTKFELPPPRATNGSINRIQEGSVYLLQATDGKFVLLRLLHRNDDALVLQYIYQPDGGRDFSIVHALPANATPSVAPGMPTLVVAPLPPTGIPATGSQVPAPSILSPHPSPTISDATSLVPATPVLVPYLNTYLHQRDALIVRRIETIRAPADTTSEIQNKAAAMDDLRQLRAWEAIPALIDEISFLNPHATPAPNSLSMEAFHPALAALKGLGKPASIAALKAIGELSLDDNQRTPNGDSTKTPIYKLHLLVMVLSGVEGPDVAAFLLHQQAKADAPHRANYEAALRELGQ